MPAEKQTIAGVMLDETQLPGAHLVPALMAALIAAVSSVTPSPISFVNCRPHFWNGNLYIP